MMGAALTQVSRWAGTGNIESCALTAASILAAHLQAWILVDFTVSSCAHTKRKIYRRAPASKNNHTVAHIHTCIPSNCGVQTHS